MQVLSENFYFQWMKMISFPFLVIAYIVLLLACNDNQMNRQETITQTNADSANKSSNDSIIDARKDSVINIKLTNGKMAVVVLGELQTTGQHIRVNVPVEKDTKVTATVSSTDSLTNIRFDRIIDTDGRSNGPLGKEVAVSVDKEGMLQLIIAHNLMSERGLAKKFKLKISVQRESK